MERLAAEASRPLPSTLAVSPGENQRSEARRPVFVAVKDAENIDHYRLEFHSQVPHLDREEADRAFHQAVDECALEMDWKDSVAKAVNANAVAAGLDFDPSYEPGELTSGVGYTHGGATLGARYTGYRDITKINKDARAEFKKAQAAGWIPRELKISVRGRKFSGGQSMDVTISGVDQADLWVEDDTWGQRYSPAAVEVKNRVGPIAELWNRDDSDSQIDYFDTMYYAHAEFDR